MTSRLHAVTIDAADPGRIARFWGGLLGWDVSEEDDGDLTLRPTDGTAYRIHVVLTDLPNADRHRFHFDLTATSAQDQRRRVERALELGGRHHDVGQLPEETHTVLADPEGNEFCVLEPGNGFLADCGLLGGLNWDGTQTVGYFWSAALGWPLVWDQDEETAIQSPEGGSKIAWGGPPVMPKTGRNRMHFDVAPAPGGDRDAEVARLVTLGATRVGFDESRSGGRVLMQDPDGNEFCVLTPR